MKKSKISARSAVMLVSTAYIFLALLADLATYLAAFVWNQQNRAIIIVMLVLPASAVLVVAVLIYTSHMTSGAVKKLTNAITSLADGDFSVRIDATGRGGFNDLYENFNKMAAELASVKSLREDYVNNFSHEVKTPIAAINGFARLLSEGSLTDEEREDVIKIIERESEKLSSISQNILLLSKVENQYVANERKEFRLDLQITDCLILQERQWSEKDISINSQMEQVTYFGDEELLRHVWNNLISNAVKFTPRGGEITVRLYRRGDDVFAEFADNGIGMTEEQCGKVFDKYYQASGKSAAGSGLGLAICKRICEICGGEISVKSKLGEGSTFIVRL